MNNYTATLKREFAKYGFVGCPLTDEHIVMLCQRNVTIEEAYMIGCDVNSGYPFDVAYDVSLEANS
jgi:hypothetical protein